MHSNSTKGTRPSLVSKKISLSLKTLAFMSLMFPVHAINASKAPFQFNNVFNKNKLTVVSVAEPTSVFEDGDYYHGFGYDLVRKYAENLNVKLEFKTVESNEIALKMVSSGQVNFAMTTADLPSIENKQLTPIQASCGDIKSLTQNGLDSDLNWVFKHADDPLTQSASGFICQTKYNGSIKQLASFYNRNAVKEEAWDLIEQNLTNRMPIYKASFQKTANQYDLDWHLLAAIGYQESYLKPTSVSPTGVRGLMMLTASTAKEMGVNNRSDAQQSIAGGAKYYDLMLSRYEDIPYPDRNWYALVAYNMGPGAVNQIQKRIKAQGKDPNNWVHFYAYLDRNKANNGQYRQAVQYVTRIRSYLERIKTSPELVRI